MRRPVTLQLNRQEAKLLIIWATADEKKSYASLACRTFDDRLIDKLQARFGK